MNQQLMPPQHVHSSVNVASNYQEARQFLAAVVPWSEDGQAYVNIHWSMKKPDREGLVWAGKACTSLDEAMRMTRWAASLPETAGVYACMSTQSQCEVTTSQSGRPSRKAIRLQENVVALKSLWLDIDFKGGEYGYANETDAIAGLAGFIKATGLPRPTMVVSTGGGFHVHWLVDRPLPPAEWAVLAFALAEATKRHGLKCDVQCTVDSARILRVPDTFNNKYGAPRPVQIISSKDFVYLVDRLASALEPYRLAVPKALAKHPFIENPELWAAGPSPCALIGPVADELGAGIEARRYDPIDLDEVAKECPFFADALATGGASHGQPMWNLAVLASTFTAGNRADARRLGNKHPGYSQASTDEMFDRKENEKKSRNLGWPSCAAISGAGSKLCQGCLHLKDGKSPLNFARQANLPAQVTEAAPSSSFSSPCGAPGRRSTCLAPPLAGSHAPRSGTQQELSRGYLLR
jgi:hypothetical protein